jgi:hypothetical protein
MIRIKGHRLSEAYAAYCLPSWEGFDVELVDALTPETVFDDPSFKSFKWGNNFFPVEYASFTSKIKCWEECAKDTVPHLIIEHDAYCDYPDYVYMEDGLEYKMLSKHATVAIMYKPEFCQNFLEWLHKSKILHGPFTMLSLFNTGIDLVNFKKFIPLVTPVIDLNEGTTIPEHYQQYVGHNHRPITLFGEVDDLKLF